HGRGHERTRAVPHRAESLGEGHGLGSERVVAVVAHAVGGWVEPGHDRAVGRQRDRRRARSIGAANPFLSQAVDRRRVRDTESVATEPVRSERVDGDEEDVRALPALAARERQEEERSGERGGGESARCVSLRAQEVFAVPDFPAVALYVKGWSTAYSPGPAVMVSGIETGALLASAFVSPYCASWVCRSPFRLKEK